MATAAELAQSLGVSIATIYNWRTAGLLAIEATCRRCGRRFQTLRGLRQQLCGACPRGRLSTRPTAVFCRACGMPVGCQPRKGRTRCYCDRCRGTTGRALPPLDDRRAKDGRRRARKLSVAHEAYSATAIFERDGWRCQAPRCLARTRRIDPMAVGRWRATIDHIVPLAAGGPDLAWNVQAAHSACNSGKRDRLGG